MSVYREPKIVIGIDVGQKRDPTALCVVETDDRDLELAEGARRGRKRKTEQHYTVRHLERMAVGASFPEVKARISLLVEDLQYKTKRSPNTVYLDATGLGSPVVDLFEEAIPGTDVVGVYFTHGDRRVKEDDGIRLGKAFLVSRLQVLLQTQRLHLPKSAEAEQLAEDLLGYEIEVGEDANERYGAFRVGARDDLVTALGLAVQAEAKVGFFIC